MLYNWWFTEEGKYMVEWVAFNADQHITKQRRKQFYVVADKKNPDGSVKRARIHIKFVVAGQVLVPFPVNPPSTAPLLTATTTNIVPANPSMSFPADNSTPVDPELLPTTTTVPDNFPTIVAPSPEPAITTTVPSNPPTHVVPEPNSTNTTCVYSNPHNQHFPVHDPTPPPQKFPVPDMNPPPTHVSLVSDTPSPTTSTPTVVAYCNGVKWYCSENVIELNEVPSLQWKFTNKFGDPVYTSSGVWMYRFHAWLVMYRKKYLLLFFTTPTWSCSGKIGTHLRTWSRHCDSKVWWGWQPILN